ncbi:monocarboxylate transporter 3-like [Patiria miniata]|uniref:Major facilitator superfamily (MFS) profile domain-containing protein n=1 Tax=Patiria miniata TaxID=46514 RepID=A0A914AMD4_PATMI|nr:monocarboxylate transporter 3-like [Patiria miniata]
MKGLAVLLPTLQGQADTYTWVIGWMIVIMEVTADLTGPIASPLERRFGIRACIMVSGVMITVAFIVSAASSSVLVMAVVLAALAGPGIGLSHVLSRELIGRCFQSGGTSTAFSISQTGTPAAYIAIPWLSQLFLDTYGYRGTLLLLGAIFFHLTACGALLRFPSDNDATVTKEGRDYISLVSGAEEGTQSSTDSNASRRSSDQENRAKTSALRSFWQNLHTELFYDVTYWLLAIIYIIIQFVYTAWLVYYVPHTQAKGFSLSDVTIFTAISGLTRILTGLSLGPLLDKIKIIGNKGFMGITLILLALYYLIDPWLTSFWSTAVNQGVYGFAIGLAWLLADVLLCEAIAVDRLGSAFGWISMKSGILRFSLLYLPGLIYDLTRSYTLTFMLLGGAHLIGFAVLLLLVWLQRRKQ